MSNTGVSLTPEQALEKLQSLYDQSVSALRDAIRLFIDHRSLPSAEARANGLFVYPQLSVSWSGCAHKAQNARLRPIYPLRLLHHNHHSSSAVPRLSAGAIIITA